MKLTKDNVCVFIEDEAQLEQARGLLVKYGENLESDFNYNYAFQWDNSRIYFHPKYNEWCYYYGGNVPFEKPITLTELEQILKDGKEN